MIKFCFVKYFKTIYMKGPRSHFNNFPDIRIRTHKVSECILGSINYFFNDFAWLVIYRYRLILFMVLFIIKIDYHHHRDCHFSIWKWNEWIDFDFFPLDSFSSWSSTNKNQMLFSNRQYSNIDHRFFPWNKIIIISHRCCWSLSSHMCFIHSRRRWLCLWCVCVCLLASTKTDFLKFLLARKVKTWPSSFWSMNECLVRK